jgi:hypothetical protein
VLSLSNQHKERLTWVKATTVENRTKRNHWRPWWKNGPRKGPRKKTKGFHFLSSKLDFARSAEITRVILLSSANLKVWVFRLRPVPFYPACAGIIWEISILDLAATIWPSESPKP